MAINPGADLLSDALAAADPQRAKAAEERLARLAQETQDIAAEPEFHDVLALEHSSLNVSGAFPTALLATVHPAKRVNPYEQFEVAVLKTLFEAMLPAKTTTVFGSGFSGEVWKSMLADSLAGVAGHAGVAGIARSLEARKQSQKPGARSKGS